MRLISAVREVLVSVRGLTVEPFKVFGQHSLDSPFLAPGGQSVQGAGHVRVQGGQGSDSVGKLTRRARLATTCWTSTRLVFVACLISTPRITSPLALWWSCAAYGAGWCLLWRPWAARRAALCGEDGTRFRSSDLWGMCLMIDRTMGVR